MAEQRRDAAEREAIMDAAQELSREPVNRELAGLALAKLMLRNYESVHLHHIRQLQNEAQPLSPGK